MPTYIKPNARQTPRWNVRALPTPRVAELLGVSESAVRAKGRDPAFPAPAERGFRNLWTEAQIYDYMRAKPSRRHRPVPRLYPGPAIPTPARFIAAEPYVLRDKTGVPVRFAAHLWDPGDGRGHIVVGYTGPHYYSSTCPRAVPEIWAARLLEPYPAWFSSAVIVVDQKRQHADATIVEPRIAVADRPFEDRGGRGGPATATWTDLSWTELQHLLQVEIPWWPPDDDSRPAGGWTGDAILSWHPASEQACTS